MGSLRVNRLELKMLDNDEEEFENCVASTLAFLGAI